MKSMKYVIVLILSALTSGMIQGQSSFPDTCRTNIITISGWKAASSFTLNIYTRATD